MDIEHKRFGSTQHSVITRGSAITLHRERLPETKRNIRPSSKNNRNKKSRSMETQSQRGTFEKLENLNFKKELEDPGNVLVKSEIKKLIHIKDDIEGLHNGFEIMRRSKSYDEKLISAIKLKDSEMERNQRFTYSCTYN